MQEATGKAKQLQLTEQPLKLDISRFNPFLAMNELCAFEPLAALFGDGSTPFYAPAQAGACAGHWDLNKNGAASSCFSACLLADNKACFCDESSDSEDVFSSASEDDDVPEVPRSLAK